MILINLYNTIRGVLYDVEAFDTCDVWYLHPFYLDEVANG